MTQSLFDFNANRLRRVRRNLTEWYSGHARDLPWRRGADAYRVWISEIMLQQTTVAAVVPYFERFLNRFPTLDELAAAPEDEVLRHWEGLGYYSRARNIHRTARLLVEENGGRFPEDAAELQKLPGVGRYTAGAIASFAFDRRAPIVEANTLRVYSRLLGYRGDPRSSAGQKVLWAFAEHVLPRKNPGRFNQALMELGAVLCTPADPDCGRCPVRTCCAALAEDAQHEIPLPAPKLQLTDLTEAAVAVCKGESYLLWRCAEGERWAGLWDFPRFSIEPIENGSNGDTAAATLLQAQKLAADVQRATGVGVDIGERLLVLKHGVTRYRITLHCYAGEYRSGRIVSSDRELHWVPPGQFDEYPLSTTGRKLARIVRDRAGGRGNTNLH